MAIPNTSILTRGAGHTAPAVTLSDLRTRYGDSFLAADEFSELAGAYPNAARDLDRINRRESSRRNRNRNINRFETARI